MATARLLTPGVRRRRRASSADTTTWAVRDPELVINGSFPCEDALMARAVPTLELWHPVKQRGCFLDFVEASAGGESQYPWSPRQLKNVSGLRRVQLARLRSHGGHAGHGGRTLTAAPALEA